MAEQNTERSRQRGQAVSFRHTHRLLLKYCMPSVCFIFMGLFLLKLPVMIYGIGNLKTEFLIQICQKKILNVQMNSN